MSCITVDEWMTVSMSRLVLDGEVVAQGLATPLVSAAYLLARHTHAPNLYFSSAIGQSMCREPAPLGLTTIETLWLDRAITSVGFARAVAEILPTLKPKEFFRPAQVDPFGNTNNIAFGKNYIEDRKCRMRLPGSGGVPDVTTFISKIMLYVPRHSRLTFVAELDVRSGLGHDPKRTHGLGPLALVSDLGVFDFANGRLRLVSYYPGVTIEQIKAKTGFVLDISPQAGFTESPTPEELRLLREEVDPLGIRRLELLSGAERRLAMREILAAEAVSMPTRT